jgi:hypothetical protein
MVDPALAPALTPAAASTVVPALAAVPPLQRATDAAAERDLRGNARDNERDNDRDSARHARLALPREQSDATLPATGLATLSVVLLLADIAASARLWGWSRLVRGPRALHGERGLRFAKLLGSGHQGGFGLRPSASLQAVFAVFDDDACATEFLTRAPLVHAYRARSRECLTVRLTPYACRGTWDRHALAPSAPAPVAGPNAAPSAGPIAALTRASIRLAAAPAFWRHAPPSQADLGHAAGCRLAIGLGEAPLLRQATFSLWDSAAAMDAYARSGAHLAAIRAAAARGFFSESMFVRFVVRAIDGTWQGRRHALA